MEYFAAKGFQVAAMNVRGYGENSAPSEIEAYTLEALSDDVGAVIATLSEEPVILFGHDWGAPIAYHTALRFEDRVRAIAGMSVPIAHPMGCRDLINGEHSIQTSFFTSCISNNPAFLRRSLSCLLYTSPSPRDIS